MIKMPIGDTENMSNGGTRMVEEIICTVWMKPRLGLFYAKEEEKRYLNLFIHLLIK